MSTAPHRPSFSSEAARLRLEARRRRYFRRRVAALLILLAALTGVGLGGRWAARHFWPAAPAAKEAAESAALPFTPKAFLKVGDIDGDTIEESVAVGPVENALRQVALVTGTEKAPKVIGKPIVLAGFDVAVVDLPRAARILVLYQKRPADGLPKAVTVGGSPALEAAGGEPDYLAWKADPQSGLVPVSYAQLVAPATPPEPTALVVDKYLNALWYYEKGQLVRTYRVATGRHLSGPLPNASTQAVNYLTPEGRYTVANKVAGLPYYKEKIPALDPRNPLGTRWLGFHVFEGDGAMVWSIHGTNEPASIGRWASDGCIRLKNADIEDLYDRVQVGTPLIITNSNPDRQS